MAKSAAKTTPTQKTEEKAPPEKSNLPATVAVPGAVPAHLASRLANNQGLGVSTAREDNIVPLILVLQKSSPCTDERSDAYVHGAKAGEFWIRGTETIISGVDGLLAQPCAFLKVWLEWGLKRGEGLFGRHDERPDDAEEKEINDEQGRPKIVWMRKNGHIVVETREHYVLIGREPYVIPMTSTQHTVSREWMTLQGGFKDNNGVPYDSFSHWYRLTTRRKEKDGNSWYIIKAVDAGWVESEQQYDLGLALHKAVMAGEKVAAADEESARGDLGEGRSGRGSGPSSGGGVSAEDADRRAAEAGL